MNHDAFLLAQASKPIMHDWTPERLVSFSSSGSDRQLALIAASCKAYGHTIVGQITGSFRKAMLLARELKADGFMFPDLQSTFRDIRHLVAIREEIDHCKMAFWLADMGINNRALHHDKMILLIQNIAIDFYLRARIGRKPDHIPDIEFPRAPFPWRRKQRWANL
jgi:hypothetical protein